MRLWIDLFFQWFQGMAGFLDGGSSASVFISSDHLAGISFDFPQDETTHFAPHGVLDVQPWAFLDWFDFSMLLGDRFLNGVSFVTWVLGMQLWAVMD